MPQVFLCCAPCWSGGEVPPPTAGPPEGSVNWFTASRRDNMSEQARSHLAGRLASKAATPSQPNQQTAPGTPARFPGAARSPNRPGSGGNPAVLGQDRRAALFWGQVARPRDAEPNTSSCQEKRAPHSPPSPPPLTPFGPAHFQSAPLSELRPWGRGGSHDRPLSAL